jgi:tRNA (guanine10-N2)-dimethyltransferase
VENHEAVLSTATSLHNGLNGRNERKVELIKTDRGWYRVIGVQDIEAYARRDQARPARDAKVGMLPPKLAQILINLCGALKPGATVLDPFCGTGVVLQEALLMGYSVYGTDISEKMIECSNRNLKWLFSSRSRSRLSLQGSLEHARSDSRCSENSQFQISQGDATSFQWQQPIDAVACEGYLGKPFSKIPSEMELKEQKLECGAIMTGFLENLAGQIKKDTPVVVAMPAWLRPDGSYERLEILAILDKLGYNVNNKSLEGLIYHREGQIVARDIIILRKK